MQMNYAQHSGSAEVPAQATEQASAASVAGEGAHVPQEKGIFSRAESHTRSLSQAAASIPSAVVSVPAAVAGGGALAAGVVSQHRSNIGQPDLTSVPEEGRPVRQQPEKAPASENSSPNLSSTCTLSSGFCTKVLLLSSVSRGSSICLLCSVYNVSFLSGPSIPEDQIWHLCSCS